MGSLKILRLPDSAFRLWVKGLCYCQTHLTDGLIPREWLRETRAKRADVEMLTHQLVDGKAPLWEHIEAFGFKVHDYLDWNDSREVVEERKAKSIGKRDYYAERAALYRLPGLLVAIKDRDKGRCRYCSVVVKWNDRRSAQGATYDHIDPKGGNTFENVVIACRRCNGAKGARLLGECDMRLLPPPVTNTESIRVVIPSPESHREPNLTKPNQTKEDLSTADKPPTPTEDRVAAFYQWFAVEYKAQRHSDYLVHFKADTPIIWKLLQSVPMERLKLLAKLMLTEKIADDWIQQSDRSIKILKIKLNWLNERLSAWEAARGNGTQG